MGGGECLHCLVGPFVGFHHQSLLIATIWPLGRGNVGYGANVGSNHTSRQVRRGRERIGEEVSQAISVPSCPAARLLACLRAGTFCKTHHYVNKLQ